MEKTDAGKSDHGMQIVRGSVKEIKTDYLWFCYKYC